MKQIYIITVGEYSDYHICGVFDDENIAELFTEKFGGDIETWELNPSEELIKKGWNIYRVQMTKEGNTEYIEIDDDWYSVRRLQEKGDTQKFGQAQNIEVGFNYHLIFNPKTDNHNLDTWVLARNEQHAIKIANERRIRLLAEDLWR